MDKSIQKKNTETNSKICNANRKKQILIVDDEPDFCGFTALGLRNLGYDVLTATDGQKALDLVKENRPDLLLMDIGLMGQSDGIEVSRQISARWQIPVVYLTGHTDDKTLSRAKATEPFGYVVKPVDYTELKTTIEIALCKFEAENKLKELNKRLEQANQELKCFAHTVSHDLKTPLRGIRRLAEWISINYANKLNEDDREKVNLLMSRVDRMHNLIDDVLQYSSIGYTEEERDQVNLNNLVHDVIDMIDPPENITITVESELPVIECEKTRIIQVFLNLLSNAVKYMDKPAGRIKIACVEESDIWKFSVVDNGPGIEEKYFEKIFQIFQTLSTHDESESSGIGLSTVKKIVEMYGGRVWVESKPPEGSTFFFTLPKQKMGIENAKLQANPACRR
jgi:signal transduction histidine kinase